jgi:hypothetical protein
MNDIEITTIISVLSVIVFITALYLTFVKNKTH